MTAEDNRERDAYLWDPGAKPSAEVQAVERRLAPARFDAARRPLMLPTPTRAHRRAYSRPLLALAATLALLVAGASAFWSWRWSWPAGGAWPLTIERDSSPGKSVTSQLRLDQRLQLDSTASARVTIARIGTMRVGPGSVLTVAETSSRRHRVVLDRGTANVRVWAPPGRFALRTPAGDVIDLGCIFDLSVDADGASRVRVDTGWVQIVNDWGESLVPAGASSVMTAATRPGVPIYDDATPAFATGVRAIERGAGDAVRSGMIDVVVRTARTRDVLTLLMLATASPVSARRPIIERAAQLFPPPPTVSVNAITDGDNDQLWRWYASLDLPPSKGWWLNWRDALPRFR
ncbi:MAG TPA: hypothetical protein VNJ04_17120 [Gemmatimonadaceae bacterium]|nr:hypothetical protein [Gemmatimonadaceae bacterium]